MGAWCPAGLSRIETARRYLAAVDEPLWTPTGYNPPGIFTLEVRGVEVARVNERVDGRGWLSEVNRHLRDRARRRYVVVRSQRLAMLWAERWTRAHLARIVPQLPYTVRGMAGIMVREYPATNPER